MNRKSKNFLLFCFFITISCFIFGFADARTYYYENIEIDIYIKKDSTFDILEKQNYFLNGDFGYFYREIELKNLDHISDIEAFDSENKRIDQEDLDINYQGNRLRIQWNFPRKIFNQEKKSWTIKYTVHGGLGFFKDWDEIYWNAIFQDREEIVENAKITVILPQIVSKEDIRVESFIGKLGSTNLNRNYEIINRKMIEFVGEDIAQGEYLTIVVGWPKGIVKKPFLYKNQLIAILTALIAIIVPIIIFFICLIQWLKKGKDEKIKKTIIAQYNPGNLLPAEVGVLVRQNINIKDILGTVVDLAVRGYLKITEEEKGFSIFKHKEYIFEKIKNETADNNLKFFEKKIMRSLFESSDIVSTKDLKNKFYKKIPEIKKEIYEEIAKTPLFRKNIQQTRKKYSLKYSLIFILILIGAIVFGFLKNYLGLPPIFLVSAVILGISLIISAIIGLIFAYFMPALTIKGAEAKWHALGFKEYLHTAERFRIEAETLETFSKFLPYAIVFEVEKEWAERFSAFKYKEQGWYAPATVYSGTGGAPANFGEFASGISSFSNNLSSAFNSSPGGGVSGGSAGGGGGGGGGGAG